MNIAAQAVAARKEAEVRNAPFVRRRTAGQSGTNTLRPTPLNIAADAVRERYNAQRSITTPSAASSIVSAAQTNTIRPTPLNIASWAAQKAQETEPEISIRQGALEPLVRQTAAKQLEGQQGKPKSRTEARKQQEQEERAYQQALEQQGERMAATSGQIEYDPASHEPKNYPVPWLKNVVAPGTGERVENVLRSALSGTGASVVSTTATAMDAIPVSRYAPMEQADVDIAQLRQEREMYRGILADDDPYIVRLEDAIANLEADSAIYRDAEAFAAREAQNAQEVRDKAAELNETSRSAAENAEYGLGTVGRFLTRAGIAGTQMLMDAAVGAATGTGMAPMLVRSFGTGTLEGYEKGYGVTGQIANGVKAAAVEYITEKLFGGNPVYDTSAGWINKLAAKVAGGNSPLVEFLASRPMEILGEGLEEALSSYLNPALEGLVTGVYDWPTAEQVLEEALIGVALGGAATAVNAVARPATAPAVEQTETENVAPVAASETQTETLTPSLETQTQAGERGFKNPFTEATNRFAALRLKEELGKSPDAGTAWSNPQNLAAEDVAATFRQRLESLHKDLADFKYSSNLNADVEENPYEDTGLFSAVVDTVKEGVAKRKAKNAPPGYHSFEDVETDLNELRQIYDYMQKADPAFDPITVDTVTEAVNALSFTDLDVKRFLPVLSRDVQQRYDEIADAYEELAARLVSGDTSVTVMPSYLRAKGIMDDVVHDAQIELAKLVPKLKANPEYLGQLLEEVRNNERAAQNGQALQEDIRRYQELISSRASRAAAFAFDPSTANRKALYDGDYTADLLRQRISERVFEETGERVEDVDAYIAMMNNPFVNVGRRAETRGEADGYLGQAWNEVTQRNSPPPVVAGQGPQVLFATILQNGGQSLMDRIDSYLDMKSRYDQMEAAFFTENPPVDPQELGALARQLDSRSLGVIKQIFDNSGYQIQHQREFEAFLKFYQKHRRQP